jgi:hypothetical protein
MTDRDHLAKFLAAIDASPTALERPVCRGWVGDYQITGKTGHVLADGAGCSNCRTMFRSCRLSRPLCLHRPCLRDPRASLT